MKRKESKDSLYQRGRNTDESQQGKDNKELLDRRKALIDHKKDLTRFLDETKRRLELKTRTVFELEKKRKSLPPILPVNGITRQSFADIFEAF